MVSFLTNNSKMRRIQQPFQESGRQILILACIRQDCLAYTEEMIMKPQWLNKSEK